MFPFLKVQGPFPSFSSRTCSCICSSYSCSCTCCSSSASASAPAPPNMFLLYPFLVFHSFASLVPVSLHLIFTAIFEFLLLPFNLSCSSPPLPLSPRYPFFSSHFHLLPPNSHLSILLRLICMLRLLRLLLLRLLLLLFLLLLFLFSLLLLHLHLLFYSSPLPPAPLDTAPLLSPAAPALVPSHSPAPITFPFSSCSCASLPSSFSSSPLI